MAKYFTNRTTEEQTNVLAQYFPNDDLFCGKNIEGHNLRKLIKGIAPSFLDVRNLFNVLCDEVDIRKTIQLISDWEKVFNIPDGCIPLADTIEARRTNILLKFAGFQGTVQRQFSYILDLLGVTNYNITNATAYGTFPLRFPLRFFSEEQTPYTIVVELPSGLSGIVFPLLFPILFTSGDILSMIRCLFNRLKPAHTVVVLIVNTEERESQNVITIDEEVLTVGGEPLFLS